MFLNSCKKVGEREENISEKANRIIDTVSQYFWDKSNRNISDDEFSEKYPYETEQMIVWKNQLTEIIGEEGANKIFDGGEKIEEGREKMEKRIGYMERGYDSDVIKDYLKNLDRDYGSISIDGDDVGVFVWDGKYPEYSSDQIVGEYSAHVLEFDTGRFALNGLDGEVEAPGWFQVTQFVKQT